MVKGNCIKIKFLGVSPRRLTLSGNLGLILLLISVIPCWGAFAPDTSRMLPAAEQSIDCFQSAHLSKFEEQLSTNLSFHSKDIGVDWTRFNFHGRKDGTPDSMKKLALIMIILLVAPGGVMAKLTIGEKPLQLSLQGEVGGRLDGSPWDSSEISGKVFTLMYISPDQKDINRHVELALKQQSFPAANYGSIAIINIAATGYPEWAVLSVLKRKQAEYPLTTYVLDRQKTLVDQWNVGDNSYVVMAFDKQGRVIFNKDGKLSSREIDQLIEVIEKNL